MKQSDHLLFVESGTLERPGSIGRTVRAVLGLACLSALFQIVDYRDSIIQSPVSHLPNFLLLALLGLCVFNYVVNIGFGKNWGRRPGIFLIAACVLLAAIGWLATGTPDNAGLGLILRL